MFAARSLLQISVHACSVICSSNNSGFFFRLKMWPAAALVLLSLLLPQLALSQGFQGADILLRGAASVPNASSALQLCDAAGGRGLSRAFYGRPIRFKSPFSSMVYSFSTTFEFSMRTGYMLFVVVRTPDVDPLGSIFRIDIDSSNNYVGLQINDSVNEIPRIPFYRGENGSFVDLIIGSGNRTQLRLEYNSTSQETRVFLTTPSDQNLVSRVQPLHLLRHDLSDVVSDFMHVGFATDCVQDQKLLNAWNFAINDDGFEFKPVGPLTLGPQWKTDLASLAPIIAYIILFSALLATYIAVCVCCIRRRRRKFSELIEDWEGELNYISHRFRYKDLYVATKGFKDTEVLGKGGFGKVYRGVIPRHNVEIAMKRISHDSSQGMKEFVAEIVSLGRLRHRNVVPLLGYCRRKGELLLVYEYMPNGSLDKFLHGHQSASTLRWHERFNIVKGVACGLLYLHEEWEQVVIHRDIKPGNVLLDAELNARLGDFGLAKLHAHGANPATTNIVGTMGYIAPEHMRTGKATKSSDVFSFGILLLEIVSGRRPIDRDAPEEKVVLLDWVHSLWDEKQILDAVDPNLNAAYTKGEAELLLKIGLFCCHPRPDFRPSARDIMGYLEGLRFPEDDCTNALRHWLPEGNEGFQSAMLPSTGTGPSVALSISHSLMHIGR